MSHSDTASCRAQQCWKQDWKYKTKIRVRPTPKLQDQDQKYKTKTKAGLRPVLS